MDSITYNTQAPASFPIVSLGIVDQDFRQWLQDRGCWSVKAERLFIYFVHQPQLPQPVSEQQRQLFKQVIADANAGINITERYPAFFRDLLQQATLRHEFMTAVTIMDK